MIQLITPAEVRGWDPCSDYTDDHIADLFGGRSALSPREIAALQIPLGDRVWALCRVMAYRAPKVVVMFAEWCAGRACAYYAASRRSTSAACAEARANAACVCESAAARFAYYAAYHAADAAYVCVSAARTAAYDAERGAQIAKALELIEGKEINP